MTSTPKTKSVHVPWEMSPPEVPWAEWPWVFDYRKGMPSLLTVEWEHSRDNDGMSVKRTSKGAPHNPEGYPRMSWDAVRKLTDDSRTLQQPMKLIWLAQNKKKVSQEDLAILADAPSVIAAGVEVVQDVAEDQAAKVDDLLAQIDAMAASIKAKAQKSKTG